MLKLKIIIFILAFSQFILMESVLSAENFNPEKSAFVNDKENNLYENSSKEDEDFNIPDSSFYISFDSNFNTKDVFLGGSLGVKLLSQFDLYGNFFFLIRPFKKSVFIQDDTNIYSIKRGKIYNWIWYRFVFPSN